jgi:hypothetical protein
MAELREVLRFPEHLRQISAEVRVPRSMDLLSSTLRNRCAPAFLSSLHRCGSPRTYSFDRSPSIQTLLFFF